MDDGLLAVVFLTSQQYDWQVLEKKPIKNLKKSGSDIIDSNIALIQPSWLHAYTMGIKNQTLLIQPCLLFPIHCLN